MSELQMTPDKRDEVLRTFLERLAQRDLQSYWLLLDESKRYPVLSEWVRRIHNSYIKSARNVMAQSEKEREP